MNNPIPALTAIFKDVGIEFTTISLTFVNERIMNTIPSKNTAVKAICHGTFIAPHTVNAKNALRPIPEANEKGKFA
ncbi:Uncharacterised protein [Clostridioides difficile]|nr:Uncharacterised protein [Clostridioides difficile]